VTMTSASDVTESLDYVINIDSSAFTRTLSIGNVTTFHKNNPVKYFCILCITYVLILKLIHEKCEDEPRFINCRRVIMSKLEIMVSD